jgi:beta-lactamase regulating signal transducer with metallopeptidase domain
VDLPVKDDIPAEPAWSIADLARWAGLAWLAIAFLMFCRHGFMSLAARRWRHSLRQPTREELAALPSAASSAPLRVSKDDVCPCVVGLWRSVIAVPQRILTAWDTRQWMWLLRHEGEHVRSRDTLTAWLLGWTKALVWWNPFVHALVEQWSQAREEICDRAAISGEPDPAPYSGFLLDVAAGATSRSPILLHMAASRPARRLRARSLRAGREAAMCNSTGDDARLPAAISSRKPE